jgi:hypothetical protein
MPVISSRFVEAAPSYGWFQAFRRHLLTAVPDAVLYVLVPRLGEGTGWQEGADWSGPRTHVIPVDMYRSQYDELALVTREVWSRFNERFGDLYFDVFLTEKPMIAPMIRRLTSFHNRGKSRKPLVITRDQFVQSWKWDKIDPIVEAQQSLGWASGPTIFQSDHQLGMATAQARAHLRPSWVQTMREQAVVFPLGIDCADVDETNTAERGMKYERVRINYSHKLFGMQMYQQSLEIMDSVLSSGRPVDLQIVTGSSESKLAMVRSSRKYQYIETFGRANRRTFLKQMARAHVFVSNSIYEDFSATVVEQIYTGLVPVLLRAPWSEYLVGADYPYLFRTPEEGRAMLAYVVDHYEQVRDAVVPGLQAMVKDRFDLHEIVPRMVSWMQVLRRKGLAEAGTGGMRELVEEAFQSLPGRFTATDLYAAIRKFGRSVDVEKDAEGNSTSKWLIVDIMKHLHPELVDEGEEQVSWKKA